MTEKFWVYILYSEKLDRFFVGRSSDVDDVLCLHNRGENEATRSGIPWIQVYSESLSSRTEALNRVREIKELKSREKIEELIS